jgi:YD repeat-containing protein
MNHLTELARVITRDVYYGYDLRNAQLYARFDSTSGEGVTNVYDGIGRLSSTTTNMGGTARMLGYGYDAGSRRERITHPDGVFFTYGYDARSRLNLVRDQGTGWLDGFSYSDRGPVTDQSYAGGSAGTIELRSEGLPVPCRCWRIITNSAMSASRITRSRRSCRRKCRLLRARVAPA